MNRKQKKSLIRIIAAAVLMLAIRLLPPPDAAKQYAFLLPYLIVGYDILIRAAKGIRRGQAFDENFLMAIASIGAAVLGDSFEASAVMLFYQIGELFESAAVGRSRRNIAALMDIRPDCANIEGEHGELVQVAPDEVTVGSIIVVRPGERIPIDSVVLSGESTLDTAALTGESAPRAVGIGDDVQSGCVNLSGSLKLRTVKEFGKSTASKILELVENASSRKSRSEAFITRFARIYTPAVCFSALALAIIPPVVRLVLGVPALWGEWVYRALTFLVISCPCALVISVPLSFFAGIGCAGRHGILIKGSNYLEALSDVTTLVFDKTGTVTKGVFEVTKLVSMRLPDNELLELAALSESYSSHPIARCIVNASSGELDRTRVENVRELSGKGVCSDIDGRTVYAGNARLMVECGITPAEIREVGTAVHVAAGGEYLGYLIISDVIKPTAAKAFSELSSAGIRRLVMLTGDNEATAKAVAEKLGIADVFSQLLPADKVSIAEKLLSDMPKGKKLAFVGDGINDAPVISRADVGIAMGALGSDAAIEAADVVLMDDDPLKIPLAIRVSKKCIRIVRENIVIAIGIKLICLLLGALGIAGMWTAIFADVGVMVIAVLNAIRALEI